jgi:hypothetical protein
LVQGNGQDPSTLLSGILRLDVDCSELYAIPDDNPFVGKMARVEIWALIFFPSVKHRW